MFDRIARSLWQNDVLKGSATALAIKFTASVLGFTMFALSSRQMEPETFGTLAIIFNAMAFLSAAALCGQETLIVRSWAEYCRSDRLALARGALTFGAQVTLGAAMLMALVVALVWSFLDRTNSLPLILAACAFLFCHSVLQFSGQF
jgi:O-antigen/teichoic acid export membrane protein